LEERKQFRQGSELLRARLNLVPRACDPWEGNEGPGIIRIRHTENCMSTELRMRWQKQNKLFEIFYCFVYKL
jgi:hypothetical protein